MKLQNSNDSNNLFFSSFSKDINEKDQNDYLNKYHNLFGNSFSDVELLDIFARNNYNDEKITNDIKTLLLIENNNKSTENNNDETEDYHLPSFGQSNDSKKQKNKYKKDNKTYSPCSSTYEKKIFQKDTDFSSDNLPLINNEENEYKKDLLLEYKKDLFKKLRNANYTYKPNKNKKDELNFYNVIESKIEQNNNFNNNNQNEIRIIELDRKKYNLKNCSHSPECHSYQIKNFTQLNNNKNIDKESKKKYFRYFFENMKNYSKNNPKKNSNLNYRKSTDFGIRKNIFDIINNVEINEKKIYTYKKGKINNFNKNSTNISNLTIETKNNIFISACYDNPQRDILLKLVNEKKKENPDKIIEFLYPQIPPMPNIPFYTNIYPQYNQYNPYTNPYIIPNPTQYSIQTPLNEDQLNNEQILNNNNNNSNNNHQSPLINSDIIKLNNNNHIKSQMMNYLTPNSFLINANEKNNFSNIKSSGIFNNSGNINTTSSLK